MEDGPKKPSAAKQAVNFVCLVVGVAAAIGVMNGMGIRGALPGAFFGAAGGGLGALVAWIITSVLLKDA